MADTQTNGAAKPVREQLKDVRQQRLLLQEKLALKQLEAQARLQEIAWPWSSQTSWGWDTDLWLRARMGDPTDAGVYVPPDQPSDRRGGREWPLYQTEMELGRLRMRSKLLVATNAYARGLVRNLVNYVIGEGCQYEVITKEQLPDADPLNPGRQAPAGLEAEVAKAQDVVDEFLAANRWNASEDRTGDGPLASTREREAVRRVLRDGEAILRLSFEPDGKTRVRWVEPAQLRNPPGVSEADGWLFGIRHENEDEENRVEYHIAYKSTEDALQRGDFLLGEKVPASEVVHLTGPDNDAVLRRGLPEFCYDTADALERASQLERNASAGAAFRAATAEIWQHHYGTQDQISALSSSLAQTSRTNPITGRVDQIDRPRPQTIRRVPEGQELMPLPQDNTPNYLTGVQGDLRQAASSVCAPEYLASGDASNSNYSSTKEAGTPFVLHAKSLQSYFIAAFKRVIFKVLAWAALGGRLSAAAVDLLDLKLEAPTVIHQNEQEKAQRDQILIGLGVVDRATVSMEWGYDPEMVRDGIQKWDAEMGPEGTPLQLPGEKGLDMVSPIKKPKDQPDPEAPTPAEPGPPDGNGKDGGGRPPPRGPVPEAEGGSFFSGCPRDEKGHCKAGGGGDAGGSGGSGDAGGGGAERKAHNKAAHQEAGGHLAQAWNAWAHQAPVPSDHPDWKRVDDHLKNTVGSWNTSDHDLHYRLEETTAALYGLGYLAHEKGGLSPKRRAAVEKILQQVEQAHAVLAAAWKRRKGQGEA